MKLFKIITTLILFITTTLTYGKTYKLILTEDNTLVMNDYFSSTNVAKVLKRAKELDSRLPSRDPFILVLNTGGGSIDAGLELIDGLKYMNRKVITITIWAASMGFHTVQQLPGKRLILTDGTLMTHKARGFFYGEFPGQIDSRYNYWLSRIKRMDDVVVKRTGGKHTIKSYQSLSENEYWCDGIDCVRQGFADALVRVGCDKSLSGTIKDVYRFMWSGNAVEIAFIYSKCPIITGMLEYQIYVNGDPLFNYNEEEYFSPPLFKGKTVHDLHELQEIMTNKIDSKNNRIVRKSY